MKKIIEEAFLIVDGSLIKVCKVHKKPKQERQKNNLLHLLPPCDFVQKNHQDLSQSFATNGYQQK